MLVENIGDLLSSMFLIMTIYRESYLKVDPGGEDGQQRGDTVDGQEREAVLVGTQHHLQAARHGLDVVVVLWGILHALKLIKNNKVEKDKGFQSSIRNMGFWM